jgi:hypothetical protein
VTLQCCVGRWILVVCDKPNALPPRDLDWRTARKFWIQIYEKHKVVISGLRREVDENWTLLGYYADSSGNSLSTFRDNLSAPSSRVKNLFLTLEDGTDRLSRNVAKELTLLIRNNPEQRSSQHKSLPLQGRALLQPIRIHSTSSNKVKCSYAENMSHHSIYDSDILCMHLFQDSCSTTESNLVITPNYRELFHHLTVSCWPRQFMLFWKKKKKKKLLALIILQYPIWPTE